MEGGKDQNPLAQRYDSYLRPHNGGDSSSEDSTHESDTSSLADEREIHQNLKRILNFLKTQDKDDLKSLDDCDHLRSEDEYAKMMLQEGVLEENKEEKDIEMYAIQANVL